MGQRIWGKEKSKLIRRLIENAIDKKKKEGKGEEPYCSKARYGPIFLLTGLIDLLIC